jgi:hypothetical protein
MNDRGVDAVMKHLERGDRNGGRWLPTIALAAISIIGGLMPVVGGASASAAATGAATCGFKLGAPQMTGALGSSGFEYPVYPTNPHQVCQVTVIAQVSLTPVSGGSFSNVVDDSPHQMVTLDFTGGALPLGIVWVWRPHCADPVVPGTFTLSVDGQTSSTGPLTAPSCFPDFGGSSSLSFDFVDPADSSVAVGMAGTVDGLGYWTVEASGALVHGKGNAVVSGFVPPLNQRLVGVVADPTGHGYWIVAADGGVLSYGGALFYGSLGGLPLNAPIVGMAATHDGGGYWLVAADGGVFAFGDAVFHGSLGGMPLNAPIVGMTGTADGGGYWLVAADGGVFAFGDAVFHGSLGGMPLNAPVVGMGATPDGGGYWLAAYDGGVFSFGDAPFEGSAGGLSLAAPVFGMATTPSGHGYWLLGGDGGIFAYGDAGFFGATPTCC